jgi:hypothetical protein
VQVVRLLALAEDADALRRPSEPASTFGQNHSTGIPIVFTA